MSASLEAGLYLRRAKPQSAGTPLPHAKHGFLRQGVAELAGKHRNLPTMMGIVRHEVTEECRDVWLEASNPPIALQRPAEHPLQSRMTAFQSFHSLGRSHRGSIELIRDLLRLGSLEPHHPHVVHVRDNSRDRTAAVTPEYSVDSMAYNGSTFYLMTGMDPQNPPYPLWDAVTTWYSCSPQGPWSNKTTVYTTPEAGANGCKVGTLFTYNAKAHSEFTDSNGILISYNVNANDSSDLVCANDYMPRFVRVQISGVTDVLK